MAYLGNAPARSFISFEKQVFTIVNSQTAYTLSNSVTNENDIRLVINNVVQEPGAGKAYTASGTTLTLSAALTNGTDEMYCVFLGKAVGTVNPPAGSVAASQLAADSVTAAKLNDDIISGQTELAVAPASTDELLISDAGVLKRIDVSLIVSSSQLAKAWVNFNGTGTVAIKDSFNVSSITDNGTGDYDINFTNAFSNTNYVCTAQTIVGNTVATCEPNTASIADFLSRDINGNSADRDTNQAVFFGS